MLSILKSALNANSQEMGVISNNIANANSTGFKKSSTNFNHFYSKHASTSPETFSGLGVNLTAPRLNMVQGSLKKTDGALDLAVTGNGFFTVAHANQEELPFFTRDGSFNINTDGDLLTNDGLVVMGFIANEEGIINKEGLIQNLVIPTTRNNDDGTNSIISNINVDASGKIVAIYGLDTEVIIGSFALSSFTNVNKLTPVGNNRYRFNQEVGAPVFGTAMQGNFGKIEAGNLERANVDITTEMVTMLKSQQAFSGVSRLLQTEVDITKRLIDG